MLCDESTAIRVGQNIFKDYNINGQIDTQSLKKMIEECYQNLNLQIPELNEEDLDLYLQIWDIDKDLNISNVDVENNAKKLLIEDDVVSFQETPIEYPPIKVIEKPRQTEFIQTQFQNESIVVQTKYIQEQPNQIKLNNIQEKDQITTKTQPIIATSYNQRTQKRLQVAERLFQQFQQNGVITEKEVYVLLTETYKQLNMPQVIKQQDVKSWMNMAHKNENGEISLNDFQQTILEGFIEAGINIK